MLSIEELACLEEDMIEALPDKLTEILSRTNRSGELEELLRLLGMTDLLDADNGYETYREGKIVVAGGTSVKKDVLLAIGKNLGIEKDRFEFCLDYHEAQKYNFKKMQYAPQYRVVIFGPVPHSGTVKAYSSGIITEMENSDAYPRVERLISGKELKITKTNFKGKLQELLKEGYI